jgi:hypothetical protein
LQNIVKIYCGKNIGELKMPVLSDNKDPKAGVDSLNMIASLEIIKNRSRFYAVAIDEIITFVKEQPPLLTSVREQFDSHNVKTFKAEEISFTSVITSVMHDATVRPPWVGKPMEAITDLCAQLGIPFGKYKLVDPAKKPEPENPPKTNIERFEQGIKNNSKGLQR